MYSRAYNLDPQLANTVTKQISKYENALKHADDDEKNLLIFMIMLIKKIRIFN